jgi:cysteine desulfurase
MVYVDANATYPVDPKHYDRVAQLLKDVDGNPSSIHARGRGAKVAVEAARASVARLLGAKPLDVVFTSGATEANNLAIQGLFGRLAAGRGMSAGAPPLLIVSATEHSSVLEPARLMAERGLCRLAVAPVGRDGVVDTAALLALVDATTAMVAVMHANNETGAVNPIRELAAAIKAKNPGVHLHVDAVQMLGKADLGWYAGAAVDSAALSAHKLGGFKGVGALYLKPGTKLSLLIAGGGQERGRRPGTENVPGIVSFGLRCDEIHGKELAAAEAMRAKRRLWLDALRAVDGAHVHGSTADDPAVALPNTVNFHVDGVAGDDLLLNFDLAGIHASSGSACSSGANRPSHVLVAMGYDEWVALNSVRVSFAAIGATPEAEVGALRQTLADVVRRVRRA